MDFSSFSRKRRFVLIALAAVNLVVICLLVTTIVIAQRSLFAGRASPRDPSEDHMLADGVTPTPTVTLIPIGTLTPIPTNTRVVPREFYSASLVEEVIEEVCVIRELQPLDEVPFKVLTEGEMTHEMREMYPPGVLVTELDRQWALYRLLGMVPEDAHVTEENVDLLTSGYAGLYVPDLRSIYVVANHTNMSAEEEVIFAHEFTHALQDQYFDLGSYLTEGSSIDADLAARALAEGDATLVMAFYTYENTTQAEWDYLSYRASFAEQPQLGLSEISESVSEIVSFPYEEGAEFVLTLFLKDGWYGVNAAFSDPPMSSEQVLHPEKYIDNRDVPVEVYLPGPPGAHWEPVLEDTLGEFIIWQHLQMFLDDADRAATAAAGWDGDRLAMWRDSSEQELVAWQLLWDSEADAEEFVAAYQSVIAGRYADTTRVDAMWWQVDGSYLALMPEGTRVWLIWAPDRPTGEALLANR